MVENTDANPRAEIVDAVQIRQPISTGENIQLKGTIFREGETVLPKGRRIRSIDVGLLAEVGCVSVSVAQQPTVAILSTGDELVPCDQKPKSGQIRNSNGPMLAAYVRANQGVPALLDSAKDEMTALEDRLNQALESDIVLLSGGVSMGQKDLVPIILKRLNVRQIFHKVNLRPGKPIWFGKAEDGTLVFGLPGNPVSSFVCFELFVRLAISKCFGQQTNQFGKEAKLAHAYTLHGNRPSFLPARFVAAMEVEILTWKGSADQKTISESDCLVFFPEPGDYSAGASIQWFEL